MFGHNTIQGRASFKHLKDDELLVTSMFYTIQGEGPYAGRPAYFLRLSGCNLACSFCDTYFDEGTVMTFTDIRSKIYRDLAELELSVSDTLLVITGGEPTIQTNLWGFLEDTPMSSQIETNGMHPIPHDYEGYIVCSPKCVKGKYIPPHHTLLAQRNLAFKFVVSADASSEYHTIPDWDFLSDYEVYISPMNIYLKEPREQKIELLFGSRTLEQRSQSDEVISFWTPDLLDKKQNQLNHEYAAQYALKHGYYLNLQMHLYASLA